MNRWAESEISYKLIEVFVNSFSLWKLFEIDRLLGILDQSNQKIISRKNACKPQLRLGSELKDVTIYSTNYGKLFTVSFD